jgi:hypothetical protein
MAKTRWKLNSRGVEALLKAPGVQADMHRRASQIAAQAGAGMEASSMVGPGRARASVITATRAARNAESSGRALTSAIDAGRR